MLSNYIPPPRTVVLFIFLSHDSPIVSIYCITGILEKQERNCTKMGKLGNQVQKFGFFDVDNLFDAILREILDIFLGEGEFFDFLLIF